MVIVRAIPARAVRTVTRGDDRGRALRLRVAVLIDDKRDDRPNVRPKFLDRADVFSARQWKGIFWRRTLSHQSHDERSLQGFDPFLPGRASQRQVHFRIYSSRVHRDHVRSSRD